MDGMMKCIALVTGRGRGEVLKTDRQLSFWGGVDPATGEIIDPRHELFGVSITGRVLVFPYGKGSAAAPLVLLELARRGTAPAAMINIETDPLLVAGPIISRHFYGGSAPVVTVNEADFKRLKTGLQVEVDGDRGEVVIKPD